MRYTVFFLLGLILGFPIGYLVKSLVSRNRSKRCRSSHCSGLPANTCLDGLCPEHCNDIHEQKCRENFLAGSPREGTWEIRDPIG